MVFLVVLVPVFVIGFALFMERQERRLRHDSVSEADVQEFIDKAQPEEVRTFVREGFTRAFKKFRRRRKANRPSRRARFFPTAQRSKGSTTAPGGSASDE